MEKLALLGGTPAITEPAPVECFKWPILTEEDFDAAMDVVRNNKFSATDITSQFEKEFAAWLGLDYAVAVCNGTMSLAAAMFAIALGAGDEIICTTKTYWASITPALNFCASPVFCNITEDLVMDPTDLERCITPRTKAIMVVHYLGHPCDMDSIMEIARKHNLLVIEDVSHAQGGLYKGKRLGTFGDVAAMSLMSGKSFAAGELGILVTNNRKMYERALAYCRHEMNNPNFITEAEELKDYSYLVLGGSKGRPNQVCTAIARVQLKYYDERCAEIRKAMNCFFDKLEGIKGLRPIRVDESTGSNMAGWYTPHLTYYPEQLGGLPSHKFAEAVRAEGVVCWEGANRLLHMHNIMKTFDLYHHGKPTRIAFNDRDVREDDKYLTPSETIYTISAPWFVRYSEEAVAWMDKCAAAIRKVAENYEQLLDQDTERAQGGRWFGTTNDAKS